MAEISVGLVGAWRLGEPLDPSRRYTGVTTGSASFGGNQEDIKAYLDRLFSSLPSDAQAAKLQRWHTLWKASGATADLNELLETMQQYAGSRHVYFTANYSGVRE